MAIQTEFPIIALWAHPRSMSTATERIMRERGDLECLHEPFMYYYYIELGKKHMPHSDLDPARPTVFPDIVADLESRAMSNAVFFKDMGYYVVPEIYDHPRLANRIRHMILIRDPRKAILSYYRLDPGLLLEEVGIEAQWRLYQWLKDCADVEVPIVEAEQVQRDPVATMSLAWEQLGLTPCPGAFNWKAGSTPEEWQTVSGWHGDVSASSGIRREPAESEDMIQRRFDSEAKKAPNLCQLLDHHMPFYRELRSRAISPA
jgi:hypothetical protein